MRPALRNGNPRHSRQGVPDGAGVAAATSAGVAGCRGCPGLPGLPRVAECRGTIRTGCETVTDDAVAENCFITSCRNFQYELPKKYFATWAVWCRLEKCTNSSSSHVVPISLRAHGCCVFCMEYIRRPALRNGNPPHSRQGLPDGAGVAGCRNCYFEVALAASQGANPSRQICRSDLFASS